jgi:hypothetical protein
MEGKFLKAPERREEIIKDDGKVALYTLPFFTHRNMEVRKNVNEIKFLI